jgi:hypothetical protein
MLAGGFATLFASGAAWLNQREIKKNVIKKKDKTLITFKK